MMGWAAGRFLREVEKLFCIEQHVANIGPQALILVLRGVGQGIRGGLILDECQERLSFRVRWLTAECLEKQALQAQIKRDICRSL